MYKKFFGSASDVTSADSFIFKRERWVCVDGLWSTNPVGRPYKPEAGIYGLLNKVAPAEGPPSVDVVSPGRPVSISRTFPVIYRKTLLGSSVASGRVRDTFILLFGSHPLPGVIRDLPLQQWSIAT